MGKITFVTEMVEKNEALQTVITRYTQKPSHEFIAELVERTTVLRLDIVEISGNTLIRRGI